jgi:ACS family glucarate transporter-like MFS transporter
VNTSLPASTERPTWIRHEVLAALLVVTTINYVQRNSISPAETTIRADLGLAINETGNAISAFFLAYAFCQIPSGWLAQRWGPRLALTVYAAGWSVCMGLCALAASLFELLGARLAMGALQAGIFPCATMILAVWYPASRRGLASALLNSFMLIGGAGGSILTGVLLGALGWRTLFAFYAVPGLLWAAWFVVWFRNRPDQHPGVNPAELAIILEGRETREGSVARERDLGLSQSGKGDERVRERQDSLLSESRPLLLPEPPPEPAAPDSVLAPGPTPWRAIFFSLPLALICAQQFLRAGAARLFDTWLPTYFQEARGGSVALAGVLASLPQWAGVVGGVVGGMLSDTVLVRSGSRRLARKGVAIGSLLVGTTCYFIAYTIPNIYLAAVVLSLGAFLSFFAAPCAYALTMDMGGRNLGIVFSTMNMTGNFGSLAFTWVVPRLVTWGGWDAGLAVFAGMNLAAAACWSLVNPDGFIGERPASEAPEA